MKGARAGVCADEAHPPPQQEEGELMGRADPHGVGDGPSWGVTPAQQ